MSDWARFLPLSNRARGDEGAVIRDWSPPTVTLLHALAGVLNTRPEVLAAPSLRPEVSTAAAVREALSALGAPWWMRWAHAIGAAEPPSPDVAAIPDDALASVVRARAIARSTPSARSSIRDLGTVLVLALDVRAAHGAAIEVDPFLCGAVALDLTLRAPMPQRSVVTVRTFVAVDSDWRVGRGPELRASAASIVLFLAGRADVPMPVDDRDAPGSVDGEHSDLG